MVIPVLEGHFLEVSTTHENLQHQFPRRATSWTHSRVPQNATVLQKAEKWALRIHPNTAADLLKYVADETADHHAVEFRSISEVVDSGDGLDAIPELVPANEPRAALPEVGAGD